MVEILYQVEKFVSSLKGIFFFFLSNHLKGIFFYSTNYSRFAHVQAGKLAQCTKTKESSLVISSNLQ